MKALVTGATGFIGSHLTERLLKSGYQVSCLVRNSSDLRWLEGLGVTLVRADCSERNSLNHILRGYDYVFHLAGLTKASCNSRYYSVNEGGARNVISGVAEQGPDIKKFVYLSSLSAFGPADQGGVNEESGPHPVSEYGKSKLRGEEAVAEFSGRVPVTVLRPAAVYGPRDREFFMLFKMIHRGLMPCWGAGSTSLVYIDDLIDAIMLAAERENSAGKTYFVSDGGVYSNDSVIDAIASALEVRVTKVRVPKFLLPPVGFFGDIISKIMRADSMINRDKMKELLYNDWVCDITGTRADLGFQPKVGLKAGIKWTADWYRIYKWI